MIIPAVPNQGDKVICWYGPGSFRPLDVSALRRFGPESFQPDLLVVSASVLLGKLGYVKFYKECDEGVGLG